MWDGEGISIENTKRGWDNLVSFAKDRENQFRGDLGSNKSKQKGQREVQGLLCTINYEKAKGHG